MGSDQLIHKVIYTGCPKKKELIYIILQEIHAKSREGRSQHEIHSTHATRICYKELQYHHQLHQDYDQRGK